MGNFLRAFFLLKKSLRIFSVAVVLFLFRKRSLTVQTERSGGLMAKEISEDFFAGVLGFALTSRAVFAEK